MGRRHLLPNINNLLLQLHLPHRSADSSNGSPKEGNHKQQHHTHHSNQDHHQHHNLHIFTWPSLKRKPSSGSLGSVSSEEDREYHDTETEAPTSQKTLGEVSTCSSHHRHSNNKSVVSFGNCEIRTYTQVLGDHPCCLEGCPIQLGWSYTSEESIRIDDYERFHGHKTKHNNCCEEGENSQQHPRPKSTVLQELRLTPEERRSILILSKQQQYVNAQTRQSASPVRDRGEGADNASDRSDETAASHRPLVATGQEDDRCGAALPAATQLDQHDHHQQLELEHQHCERELSRECRRLNRCGGWNVNVKATRKRNKRNQEAFFGAPVTTAAVSITPSVATTIPEQTTASATSVA